MQTGEVPASGPSPPSERLPQVPGPPGAAGGDVRWLLSSSQRRVSFLLSRKRSPSMSHDSPGSQVWLALFFRRVEVFNFREVWLIHSFRNHKNVIPKAI